MHSNLPSSFPRCSYIGATTFRADMFVVDGKLEPALGPRNSVRGSGLSEPFVVCFSQQEAAGSRLLHHLPSVAFDFFDRFRVSGFCLLFTYCNIRKKNLKPERIMISGLIYLKGRGLDWLTILHPWL